ncbi:hypothetical protein RUM44_001950 [Polyplax serrata]|uniref:Xyloside xylosyltransferase 1 n=1 Tax=Polyplax serrata TaxID=468196 RepID=A0ABR1AN88_POLSC
MRLFYKILLNLSVLVSFIVIFFAFHEKSDSQDLVNLVNYEKDIKLNNESGRSHFAYSEPSAIVLKDEFENYGHNIWCIFCKATPASPLRYKFSVFVLSLVNRSSVPLTINLITDDGSRSTAQKVFEHVKNVTKKDFQVTFHDIRDLAAKTSDIINTMRKYFTSQTDSYYSDALFFISLGLHRIAVNQTKAIMIDVDTKLNTDVKLLFDEFNNFGSEALIGIAPEQSPVYRHVLYVYRAKYRDTNFGKPLSQNGNPGVNSGVLLLNLARLRESDMYNRLLSPEQVKKLVDKYSFQGHLGDQDWYTLISQEYKQLIHLLDCTWNRQLCQWWSHHGYEDIFNMFYRCEGEVKIYHGNCNTKIP